jgi:O-antigen/teichoic acid export membrane protein
MSQFRKLAGETAIYGVSSIVGRMLNYLLVPFYTAIFNPAEYGVVNELYAYVAFLNVLYTFGMETAYFRFAYKNKGEENKVFNAAQTSILVASLLFTVVLCLFATPIINLLRYPGKEVYVYWLAAILAIDAIVAIPFARLRLEKKPVRFASAKMGNILLNILLNVFFLIWCPWLLQANSPEFIKDIITKIYDPGFGIGYIFLSNLIANAFFLVFLGKIFLRYRPVLDFQYLKPMLIYGYPILFLGLAGMTNEMLSRILLRWWLPEDFYPGRSQEAALGIFSACYKLSIFMSLVIQAFRFAAEPFFFSKADDKNSPQTFATIMHWFTLACCLIYLTVSINLDVFKLFLRKPVYWEGLEVVPVLLLANLFLGVYYNLSVWFKLTDKTYYGTWISVGGALLTLILNILLIPVLGYFGSSLATLACYFSMAAACYYYGQKFFPVPYQTGKGLAYILGTTALIYLVLQINFTNQILATSFHLVVILVYCAAIYFLEKPKFQIKRN